MLLLSTDGLRLVPILFPAVALLACLEKLASVANTVAMERDWVGVKLSTSKTTPFLSLEFDQHGS
jgi:Ferroportin1 (FPN1)